MMTTLSSSPCPCTVKTYARNRLRLQPRGSTGSTARRASVVAPGQAARQKHPSVTEPRLPAATAPAITPTPATGQLTAAAAAMTTRRHPCRMMTQSHGPSGARQQRPATLRKPRTLRQLQPSSRLTASPAPPAAAVAAARSRCTLFTPLSRPILRLRHLGDRCSIHLQPRRGHRKAALVPPPAAIITQRPPMVNRHHRRLPLCTLASYPCCPQFAAQAWSQLLGSPQSLTPSSSSRPECSAVEAYKAHRSSPLPQHQPPRRSHLHLATAAALTGHGLAAPCALEVCW